MAGKAARRVDLNQGLGRALLGIYLRLPALYEGRARMGQLLFEAKSNCPLDGRGADRAA